MPGSAGIIKALEFERDRLAKGGDMLEGIRAQEYVERGKQVLKEVEVLREEIREFKLKLAREGMK